MGVTSTAVPTTPVCRTFTGTNWRLRARGAQQRRGRVFQAGADRRQQALDFSLHRTGIPCPPRSEAQPTEDLSAITFSGRADRHRATRSCSPGGRPAEPTVELRFTRRHRPRVTTSHIAQLARESIYPVVEGYKDSVAFGGHARFSDPLGMDGLNLTVELQPRRLESRVQGARARLAAVSARTLVARA